LNLRIPQSLAAQFTLAVWALALLIVAGGATAIYTLSASATAIRQLAEQRLTHLQEAQDLVQRTLLIERKALQLSGINTLAGIRETHRQVIWRPRPPTTTSRCWTCTSRANCFAIPSTSWRSCAKAR